MEAQLKKLLVISMFFVVSILCKPGISRAAQYINFLGVFDKYCLHRCPKVKVTATLTYTDISVARPYGISIDLF